MAERRTSRGDAADDGRPGGRRRAGRDRPEASPATRVPRAPADDEYEAAVDEPGPAEADEYEYEPAVDQPVRTARQAVRAAVRQVTDLTGKQAESVTDVERREDGWMIGIEVVEDRRIPSSADILAGYQATVDLDGELIAYRRVGRYIRGRADSDGRA